METSKEPPISNSKIDVPRHWLTVSSTNNFASCNLKKIQALSGKLNHVITLLITVMESEWKSLYHVLLKHEEHLAK